MLAGMLVSEVSTMLTNDVVSAHAIDRADVEGRVEEILNRHPAVGLAFGLVKDGRLGAFIGHGMADIASNTPVTESTVFRIASISKTFTAIAVMQLWEQGLVDLDAPVTEYLRSYRLVPKEAGFRPATLHHLLTHTSGIGEVANPAGALVRGWFGESVAADERVPTLAEYYRGRLPVLTEPGARFGYTDHGFATAGQIVEDVSGEPLGLYMRSRIFEPLGMMATNLIRSESVMAGLATGYKLGSRGPKPISHREWVTAAASSIYSTPADMALYLAALLGGGANQQGAILKPETVAMMFEPQYQPDPRLPGIGLSFFRVDLGGHRAVEHQGILPGFNSQIFLAPDDGIGLMAFTNGSRGAMLWLPAELGAMLGDMIGGPDQGIRKDVPHHPEIWPELFGRYRVPGPLTDVRMRAMLGVGAEVLGSGDRLVLRILSPIPSLLRGLTLNPDDENDPYVFRLDLAEFGLGTSKVVFGRRPDDGGMSVHLDLMPLSLHKRTGDDRRLGPT
jgi:CubicO group peptidase (beta-lactamase class C family)